MSSRQNARSRKGTGMRSIHSDFRLPMNRSTTAMLPRFPTAPKRGRILFFLHHSLKLSHQNCLPLSQIKCFGLVLAFPITRSRMDCTAEEVGHDLNTPTPKTHREYWSRTTATHQQNGQSWGNENGGQEVQNPDDVGMTVRSTCQTWFGCLAMTTVPGDSSSHSGSGSLSSRRIRPMVVAPRCNLARQRVSAMRTLPMGGHRALRRWTRYRTKSGKRLTGSGS